MKIHPGLKNVILEESNNSIAKIQVTIIYLGKKRMDKYFRKNAKKIPKA